LSKWITLDIDGWHNYFKTRSGVRAKARATARAADPAASALAAVPPVVVDEDEIDGTSGGNDVPATAQRVTFFGTGAGRYAKIRVLGSLDNETVTTPAVSPVPEDDGSIPLAGPTGIGDHRNGAVISSLGRVVFGVTS
jgi:hypothetical protein